MQDLITAIYRQDLPAIRALIPMYHEQLNKPCLDAGSNFKGTLLMHAVRTGNVEVVRFLLELRDEDNHRLIYQNTVVGGKTALDQAYEAINMPLFDLLRQHHAVRAYEHDHNSQNPTVNGCAAASLARLKARYGDINTEATCETFRNEVTGQVRTAVDYLIDTIGHYRVSFANDMSETECLAYVVTAAKDSEARTAEQVEMTAETVLQIRRDALHLGLINAYTAYGTRSACQPGFFTQIAASLHMVHPNVITAADPEEAMGAISRSLEDVVTALFSEQSFPQQLALLQALADENYDAPAAIAFYNDATDPITKALTGFPNHILPPEHHHRYLAEKHAIQFRLAAVAAFDFIAILGRRIAHQNRGFDASILFTPGPQCTNLQEQVNYLQQALIIPSVQLIRRGAGGITGPLFKALPKPVQNEIVQSLLANNKSPIRPLGKIDEPLLLQCLAPHLADADFTACCEWVSRGTTLSALLFRNRSLGQQLLILKPLIRGSKDILTAEGTLSERQLLLAMQPTLTPLEFIEVIKSRQHKSTLAAVLATLPQSSQLNIIEAMRQMQLDIILGNGNLNESVLLLHTLPHLTGNQLNTVLADEDCAVQLRTCLSQPGGLARCFEYFSEISTRHDFINRALEHNIIDLKVPLSYSDIFLILDNMGQSPARALLWDILFAKLQATRAHNNLNQSFLRRTHHFDELRPLFPSIAATTLAEFVQHTTGDVTHDLNDGLAYLQKHLLFDDFDNVLLALGAPYFSVETPNNWFETLTTFDSSACKVLLTRLHKLELLPPWFSNLQTMIAKLQLIPRTRLSPTPPVINFILENLPFAASIAQLETTASLVFILKNTAGNNTRLLEQVTPELLESIVKCSDDLTLLIEAVNSRNLFDLICKIKPEKLKEICSLRQLGDILYKIGNSRTSSLVDNKEHKVIFKRIYSPAMGTKAPHELFPLLSTTTVQSIYDVIYRQLTTEINTAASVANLLSNRAANLKNSPYLAINAQGKIIMDAILINVFPDIDVLLQGLNQTDLPGENNPILEEIITTPSQNRLLTNIDDIIQVLARNGGKDFTLMLEKGLFNKRIKTGDDLKKLIAFMARTMVNYVANLDQLYQKLNIREIIPSYRQLEDFQISLNYEFSASWDADYRDAVFLLRIPAATLQDYLSTPDEKAGLLRLSHNPAAIEARLATVSAKENNVFYQFTMFCCHSIIRAQAALFNKSGEIERTNLQFNTYIDILQSVKGIVTNISACLIDSSHALQHSLRKLQSRIGDSIGREGGSYRPGLFKHCVSKNRLSSHFDELINLNWNDFTKQFEAFQRILEQPEFKTTVDPEIYNKLRDVFPTMEPLEETDRCSRSVMNLE